MSDKGLPASLDKDGECCYDRLDACGVCGGSGVMRDSFGGCCQVRVAATQEVVVSNCTYCERYRVIVDERSGG